MKMDPIQLPAIYCPFPSRINPHVEVAGEHVLAWATRFRLIQKDSAIRRFLGSHFAGLAARAYPLVGLEELSLLSDWAAWLLLIDDQFDDGQAERGPEDIRSILDQYRAILAHPDAVPLQSPAAAALGELCQRTSVLVAESWWGRFSRHFAQHFDTYTWTAANRALRSVPDFDTYIEKRRHSGAMTMAIDLIEPAEHIVLPASLLASPEFKAMACITNDVVCWTNDIFSLEKEIARGDVNNLVLVIQQARSLTLQQAINVAATMISSAVQLFEQTERALPSFTPELRVAVQAYVGDLKAWMRGNLEWSAESYRYAYTRPGEAPSYLEAIVGVPKEEHMEGGKLGRRGSVILTLGGQ